MIERVFVEQGWKRIEMDAFLRGELEKAGFTKAEVIKTPLVTRIIVHVTRPGMAIGKSGQNIKMLTETIGKRFGIENPQLEIKEIERPNLDATAVAERLKSQIERGMPWRSVLYRTISDIMNAGAQGVEIKIGGKLTGKGGRKRRVRVAQGYLKKVGEQASYVDYAKATASTKPGTIGIKVKLVKPETLFPDKIKVREFLEKTGKLPTEKPAEAVVEKVGETAEITVEEKVEKVAEEKTEAKETKSGKKEKEAKPETREDVKAKKAEKKEEAKAKKTEKKEEAEKAETKKETKPKKSEEKQK